SRLGALKQRHGLHMPSVREHIQYTDRLQLVTAFSQYPGVAREGGRITTDINDSPGLQLKNIGNNFFGTIAWRIEQYRIDFSAALLQLISAQRSEIGSHKTYVGKSCTRCVFAPARDHGFHRLYTDDFGTVF